MLCWLLKFYDLSYDQVVCLFSVRIDPDMKL